MGPLISSYKRIRVETRTSSRLVRYGANVLRSVGRIETRHVAQQQVQVRDAQGGTHTMLAVVMAALRSVTRAGRLTERSLYDVANRSPKRITA